MHADVNLIIDLAMIALYFIVVIYVGLKFGGKEDSLASFALGGRSMPWWAVFASIIAAETSAATFLGVPGEGYQLVNYTYLQLMIGTILGRVIVAYLFIKPFYDYKVFSIYEYLEIRFGPGTRYAASATFLVTRLLASGARLYVAAIILAVGCSLALGVQLEPQEQLLLYISSITLITLITAVYTSIGGIKSVVWTDCIQSAVMLGGSLSAVVVLLGQMPNGVAPVIHYIEHATQSAIVTGTTSGVSLLSNAHTILTSDYTIWAGLLGSTFATLATHGTDQDMVQRMLTASDYKKSRLSLVLSGLADLPIGFIFITIGILLKFYYDTQPVVHIKTNEVFAYFILTKMPVGLRGLLVAGVFATAMGSLSAALNALATSYTRDFYQSRASHPDDAHAVSAARRFTYVFAVILTVVASATAYFVIEHPDSRVVPIVLGIFGYTYGSLLGIFLLGFLTKHRGTDLGNYIAMASGFLVVALLTGLPNQILESIGAHPMALLQSIPVISFPWRIMLGAFVTLAVGSLYKKKLVPAGDTH